MLFLLFLNFILHSQETKITGNDIKIPFHINASTSQQYVITIDTNSNSNDGYVVSITTNGSLTYLNQGYKLIEKKVFDNVNSITFSNLSKNKLYYISYNIRVNSNGRIYLRFNNEANNVYRYTLITMTSGGNLAGLGSVNSNNIPLTYNVNLSSNFYVKGKIYFGAIENGSNTAVICSAEQIGWFTDNYLRRDNIGCQLVSGNNGLNSVTIYTDANNMTGNAYLFQEVYE